MTKVSLHTNEKTERKEEEKPKKEKNIHLSSV